MTSASWGANPLVFMNGRCVIHLGDVFDRLRDIPDASMDTIVFSPPYWGLRDYGTAFWVEGDPHCDHIVGSASRTPWANRIKGPNGVGKHGWHDSHRTKFVGGTCMKCGARRADYQIGLEPTLGQHIDVMIEVCAELWRVLKPTGSMWMNYGDCYATEPNGRSAEATKAAGNDNRTFRNKPMSTIGPIDQRDWATPRGVFEGSEWGQSGAGTRRVDHGGRVVAGGVLKNKDLCMIPNRLAIALQEWGWWVRSEIIWGKPNAMPDSSGRGRPSTAHEKIFLFTKSDEADVWYARDTGEISFHPDLRQRVPLITKPHKEGARWIRLGAYYDARSVMQPSSPNTHARMAQDIDAQAGSDRAHAGGKRNGRMKAVQSKVTPRGASRNNESYNAALMTRDRQRGLTTRHEGQINHTGLNELGRGEGRLLRNFEHDAPEPMDPPLPVWPIATVAYKDAHYATFPPELAARCILAGCPEGGTVLDPFGGHGTTALVALRLGRRAELIELKPDYAEAARQRIEFDWMGEDERARVLGARKAAALRAAGKPLPAVPLFEDIPSEAAE